MGAYKGSTRPTRQGLSKFRVVVVDPHNRRIESARRFGDNLLKLATW